MDYVLAIDLGNSSGRHMLGWLEDGKLCTQDVYRFENNIAERDNTLYWDVDTLCHHILAGIKKCAELGKIPKAIGIDAFGLDYVMLDESDSVIDGAVCYRDERTKGMVEEVCALVGREELYARTGIQFMRFNTIFQLYYLAQHKPEQLASAKDLLLLPSYFAYCLTGIKANEYTNATTTGMVQLETKTWDKALLDKIGVDPKLLCPLMPAGAVLGSFSEEVQRKVGFNAQVILPPTHDTASAYLAAPNFNDSNIILSSGTWSLLGVETMEPICNAASLEQNFTNEGGYEYRYRYLKNITGLWMLQEVRRNYDRKYSFDQLNKLAEKCLEFSSVIDVTKEAFTKPESMVEAIRRECAATKQSVPQTPGEICKCVINSLALDYSLKVKAVEQTTGKAYEQIIIVGGGSRNRLLNQSVANRCGKAVLSGLAEATSIGNILCQLITLGQIKTLEEGRGIVRKSFDFESFLPKKN